MSDLELLRQCRAGDAAALAALAQRHYGWLYATARRQVRDAHVAEDVAQAVFIVLMQRPPTLKTESSLSAWLFTVVRFAAKRALRSHRRRVFHENRAAAARTEQVEASTEQIAWMEMQMHLDDAVARLNQAEREAVLLRFYQDHTFVEVGSAMGISEDAARKRVERALTRLRNRLSRRGVSISAAALGPQLLKILSGASAMKAPAIAQAGAPSGMIAQGVIHMIWTTQVKLLTAIAITALTTAATTSVVVTTIRPSATAPISNAPLAQPTGTVTQNRSIVPSDLLEIQIDDLSAVGQTTSEICQVDPQSRVYLPFVKLVNLAGTTIPQAEADIAKAYEAKSLLRHAQVRVRQLDLGTLASLSNRPIQSGDALRVMVDGIQAEEAYSEIEVPVSANGTVQLPFVGPVLVKGLTLEQSADAIARAYAGHVKANVGVSRISQEGTADSAVRDQAPGTTRAALN